MPIAKAKYAAPERRKKQRRELGLYSRASDHPDFKREFFYRNKIDPLLQFKKPGPRLIDSHSTTVSTKGEIPKPDIFIYGDRRKGKDRRTQQ